MRDDNVVDLFDTEPVTLEVVERELRRCRLAYLPRHERRIIGHLLDRLTASAAPRS